MIQPYPIAQILSQVMGIEEESHETAVPLYLATPSSYNQAKWPSAWRLWLEETKFTPKVGQTACLPDAEGSLAAVIAVVENIETSQDGSNGWGLAHLPSVLPSRIFALNCTYVPGYEICLENWLAGWAAAHIPVSDWKSYSHAPKLARLLWPDCVGQAVRDTIRRRTLARSIVRHLIDLPANAMSPLDLTHFGQDLMSAQGDVQMEVISGEALEQSYPAIHAVGVGAERPPALLDAKWIGADDGPTLTLIGKGVVFDTGGYNLKLGSSMRLMKKDMGGAAHAIALAFMIIDAALPVRLRLLVPCAENSVSGQAMRPGDIISTRKGVSVEIGNTDAEGRLLLADALVAAGEDFPLKEQSHRIVDFATLTGAARVALGTEIPALFCNCKSWASDWADAAEQCNDMVWRLPIWEGYRKAVKGRLADLDNDGSMGGYGGAITAALFLDHFVPSEAEWSHIDLMAYNTRSKPGRPEGGEAQSLMAAFETIQKWIQPRTDSI